MAMKKQCANNSSASYALKDNPATEMDVFFSGDVISKLIYKESFRSSAFAILLVTKGELNFNYEFASYTIPEKHVFFVLPGALCEIKNIKPDVSFVGLVFTRAYLKKQGIVFSSADFIHLFSANILRIQSLSEEEYTTMQFHFLSLKKKMKLLTESADLKEIVRHSFLSILYEVFLIDRKQRSFNPVKLNRREELTSDFLTLMSENYQKERKVQFYAKELFVTPRHLSQVVKQVTGKTAGELIDEMVIKEAKVLLSANTFNISQVTDTLNFSDQSFFGKFFKKHTGTSPSGFKISNGNMVENPPF